MADQMIDDRGATGYTGAQIYRLMTTDDQFGGTLATGQDTASQARAAQQEAAEELAWVHGSVGQSWRGEAAEAFKAKLDRVRNRSALAASKVEPSNPSMGGQNDAFSRTRHEVVEVPDQPDDPNWFVRNTGWTMGFMDSAEDKRAEWEQTNQHNIEAYERYRNTSQLNWDMIERDYSEGSGDNAGSGGSGYTLSSAAGTPGGGGLPTATPTAAGMGAGGGAYGGSGAAGASGGSAVAPGVPGVPAGAVGGAVGGGAGGGTGAGAGVGSGGVRLPDGSIRYPDGSIRRPDGSLVRPDGTVIPPSGTSASGVGGAGGRSGGDFGPVGSGAVAGGAGMAAGGLAAGGAAGARPGGAAGAGGAGGMAGAGALSGQGGFGPTGSGAAGAAGGGAGGGAAAGARAPMGGMMGAGAGGRGGQGGEDDTHQRKFIQDEQLDTGLPVVRDEHGEKEYDPVTGMVIIDGVIGE
ncbi:hypothetical protein [Haloechinothrix sp. LS1_15]|uniref:hypothetical protein n=1 Tax=Haloechinothrix sp. LS1_15 TaxID=2652248 RepID=UPI0029479E1B|nr:hypothetical protein [Haloechinothrix sp. LS1_15]MDV6012303.1 hypothetical protein [Haloechinothrix sp. LS1_15]